TVRFPTRSSAAENVQIVHFEDSKASIEYTPVPNTEDIQVYSLTLNSINAFIDKKTNEPIMSSDIEYYISNSMPDSQLIILLRIAQFVWGMVEDSFDMINMSGEMIKTIKEEAESPDEEEEDIE